MLDYITVTDKRLQTVPCYNTLDSLSNPTPVRNTRAWHVRQPTVVPFNISPHSGVAWDGSEVEHIGGEMFAHTVLLPAEELRNLTSGQPTTPHCSTASMNDHYAESG
jgi:hypothetical protein